MFSKKKTECRVCGYGRFKNDSQLYQLLSIGNRLTFLPF